MQILLTTSSGSDLADGGGGADVHPLEPAGIAGELVAPVVAVVVQQAKNLMGVMMRFDYLGGAPTWHILASPTVMGVAYRLPPGKLVEYRGQSEQQ